MVLLFYIKTMALQACSLKHGTKKGIFFCLGQNWSYLSRAGGGALSLFSFHHLANIKQLVRLRLGFSLLREYKFRCNFHDALNPLCSCKLEPEIISHYLLCCHNFSSASSAFINDLIPINPSISQSNETVLTT